MSFGKGGGGRETECSEGGENEPHATGGSFHIPTLKGPKMVVHPDSVKTFEAFDSSWTFCSDVETDGGDRWRCIRKNEGFGLDSRYFREFKR